MRKPIARIYYTLSAALLTITGALPALADDTEIYQTQSAITGAKPNVLFIMDTSGSMDTKVEVTTALYDPTATYSGSCVSDRIYYSTDDEVPTCATDNWFPASSNTCNASKSALASNGGGVWPGFGNPAARTAQLGRNGWRAIRAGSSRSVECQADDGKHGEVSANDPYINDDGWGDTDFGLWAGLTQTYRLYSGNYVNYRNASGSVTEMTRLQIVRDVAVNLASSLQDVNLGLMRYSSDAEGGYVLKAVGDIDTNRTAIITELQRFSPLSGDGYTPLSETFYEAALYLKGDRIDFGDDSSPGTSEPASRNPQTSTATYYDSPIKYQCQKNYVVYLTDGLPTRDHSANSSDRIPRLTGKTCAADPFPPAQDSGYTEGSGLCMDDLAAYLASDATDLSSQPGNQNALTYMIGFGSSVANNAAYLDEVAKAGGTRKAYTATDVVSLTRALQTIFSDIKEDSATFATPSIQVNAFNRAQTGSELYFPLFKVGKGVHWPGNLKKYALNTSSAGTRIVDSQGTMAVNTQGYFAEGTTSFWSASPDGGNIEAGGAVSRLPDPASRRLFTYLGDESLSANVNVLSPTNTALTDQKVGAGASTTSCSAVCQEAISWARGVDLDDLNNDGSRTDAFKLMGDPLHGQPALVSYGGTADTPDPADAVVFLPTNDGFLHAFEASTGAELWAFMPPELLSRLAALRQNLTTSQRTYGLDGEISVLKLDKNQNGIVESGDRVWIFFGMRSGGNHYYGLDVTDPDRPVLLWNLGPEQLPGIGQTWSTPVVARVKVTGSDGNDDPEKFVLIFGGGYDPRQESQPYSVDAVGNALYIVDAQTGKRLWYASGPSIDERSPDLLLDSAGRAMSNSIPGRVTVIDFNGDLFADRMYAADMGGRLWRFDIFNGKASNQLVAGGVLAKLGSGGMPQPQAVANNRRFYNAPDVSLVRRRSQDPYFNIAIGSGYRGHPLNTATQERFYSVRDKQPFALMPQEDYDNLTPILDSDLVDVTSDPFNARVPPSARGWKLSMSRSGWVGEKVLAESTTVNNVVLFTSYEPVLPGRNDMCNAGATNRVYALSVDSGRPSLDYNDDGQITNADLFFELNQKNGIVSGVNVAFLRSGQNSGAGDPPSSPIMPPTLCVAGVEVLRKCVSGGGTLRTFWDRANAP